MTDGNICKILRDAGQSHKSFICDGGDAGNQEVTIPAGAASVPYGVTTVEDSRDEPNGEVTVTLLLNTAYTLVDSRSSATVEVWDNDDPSNSAPTVATAIPDQSATVGAAFSYVVPEATFSDTDNDALSYTATLADDDGSDLPAWLTFTEEATRRAFSGRPVADDTGTVTVRVTADDGNGGTVSDEFVITVHPAPALVLAPAQDVSVGEGDTARYTVRLAGKPTGTVTVTIASDDTGAVTVADTDAGTEGSQNTLTFTTTDWNTPQSVTVRGVEDADASDEDVTLTHTAAGGNYAGVTGALDVTVSDDETPNRAPTVDAGLVDQSATVGAAFSYVVPEATFSDTDNDALSYTATLADDDGSDLPAWLTFTEEATRRAFSGRPVADDTGTVTVRVTADDGNGGTVSDEFVITVHPAPALVLAPAQDVSVGEGDTARYTVRLAGKPTGTVTVTIASDDTGAVTVADTDAGTEGSQNTLTFTTTDWNTPQSVTVRGVEDADASDEDVTLTHTAAGGNYAGVTGALDVTVSDDETPNRAPTVDAGLVDQSATVGAAFSYVVPEATFSDTDNDALSYTATLADDDGSDLPAWLTFTEEATRRAFSGRPVADDTGTVTVRVTADDGNGGTVSDEFVITVHPAPALVLAPAQDVSVGEGDTARYTVRLAGKPTGTVTVTIASDDTGAVTVADTDAGTEGSQNTLTFTTTDWNTPQSVTVRGVEDADASDEDVTLTHTAAGGNYAGVTGALDVTVSDDETPNRAPTVDAGLVDQSATVGAAFSYVVPEATFSDTDNDALSYTATLADDDGSDLPAWLTFTEEATRRAFSGRPVADDTGTVTVRVTADDGNGGTVSDEFVITVHPAPALVLAPAQDVSVGEGDTARYTVRLAGKPTGTVTVTIASDDTGAVTVADTDAGTEGSQNTLTFTTTDWNTPQSVTVRGVEDADASDEDVTLTHTAAGGNYAGVTGALDVTVSDDETPNRAPTVDAGLVDQSATVGAAFSYVVPEATFSDTDNDALSYTATLADDDGSDLPAWLTFTEEATRRAFSGRPVADDTGTVTVRVTADDGNGGTVSDEFVITVHPAPALVLAPAQDVSVGEGDTARYTVRLAGKPTGTVTVTIASDDTGAVTVADTDAGTEGSQNTLTFTTTDWNTPQSVTVRGVEDADASDEDVTLTHTAAGGNYAGVTGALDVTVSDDETPNRAPTVDAGLVDQSATVGAAFSYVVPEATFSDTDNDALSYTATLADDDGSDLPAWLTFTEEATRRAFSGRPVADDTGTVTVRVTADDGNGGTVSDEFVITVHPAPALVFAPAEDVSVDEGDTASYTVRLAGKPTGTVTVTIASDDTGAVTVADTDAVIDGPQNTLSFTTTTWNTAQSVTVRGVEDDDATDEDVALTHTAAGGNYAGVTGTLAVRVSDDDMRDDLAAAAADAGLVRFGRTVGEQSVSAVRDRLSADRRQGFTGSLAGQALPSMDGTSASVNDGTASSPVNEAVNEAAGPGAEISEDAELAGSGAGSGGPTAVTALRSWLAGPGDAVDAGAGAQVRALDATDIVAGTSFALTRETDGGGTLALWGRGVHSGFSGQQDGIDIDGTVTGFQLGADHARGDWTYGLMVSRSTGDIEYSAAQGGGEIGLDLTALVPYVGWDVTAGLSAWGTLGFGRGDMTLTPETPETPDGGAVLRSDIDWQMAAAGVEGILTPSTRVLGGAALNWHADALWTRTRADALPGRRGAPGGETTRLRFGLESRWQHSLASGGVLTPQLEMALRHDGGDAETGFGLEIGGGLDWSAPERGLSLGLSGRTLALHEDGSFGDWGVAVVLDYDPAPDTKRGFAARLSHDLGGAASGGAQALLGPESFPGLNEASGGGRWALEAAYGVSRGRGRVGSSYMALNGADAGTATRMGYRLEPDAPHAEDVSMDVSMDVWAEPALQDTTNPGNTNNHRLGMDLKWKW